MEKHFLAFALVGLLSATALAAPRRGYLAEGRVPSLWFEAVAKQPAIAAVLPPLPPPTQGPAPSEAALKAVEAAVAHAKTASETVTTAASSQPGTISGTVVREARAIPAEVFLDFFRSIPPGTTNLNATVGVPLYFAPPIIGPPAETRPSTATYTSE